MANGDLDVTGLDELLKRLGTMGDELQESVEDEALKEGAEPIRAAVEKEAPVSDEVKQHARDHIIIVKRRNAKGRIDIQPHPDFYYLKFPEFGTSSQPAQPFMERAAKKASNDARKRIAAVIKRRLGL